MTTLSSSRPETTTEPEDLDLERDTAEVTFWRQATPGTTYVRCLLPARVLNGQCLGVRVEDLDWDREKDRLVMPRQKGKAAVWQFLGDEWRSRIAWAIQDQGVRTLMEVDDNYTAPSPLFQGHKISWHRTIEEALGPSGSGYSNEMHRKIIPTLNGVIVSTPYLQRKYLEYTDDVFLCPNTVDPDDWLELEEKPTDVLRIVYSGSPSHIRDAPQVKKALKWASRQPGVEVWTQGFKSPWTFAQRVPWTPNLASYRRSLGAFHVGLAPLVAGEWADGKSDLKALEYTMAGVLPLVGREEPYREWASELPILTVDSDEGAWLDQVKWIVRNRDIIPSLLDLATNYVLDERTTAGNAWRWQEALDGST